MCQEYRFHLDLRTPTRRRRARVLEANLPDSCHQGLEPERRQAQSEDRSVGAQRPSPPAGLIPVCAWCGHLRAGDSTWVAVDMGPCTFITASITHTICPECSALLMDPEIA